jgi:hypothetical protein
VSSLIHRYSGGIPRRINKLAADALEEAYRIGSRTLSTDIVRNVINRQRLLPHLTLLTGKGRRRSDPKGEARSVADAGSVRDSPERLVELVARIDSLEAAKAQAEREADARNKEILSLREDLDARKQDAERLVQSVAAHAALAVRQEQALAERAALLLASEGDVKRLGADLSQVLRSRDLLQERLVKANAAIAELTRAGQQLKATAEKVGEVESLRAELEARNAALASLEQLVQRLGCDLEQERAVRVAAERARDEAQSLARQLGEQHGELQAAARKLDTELKTSRERAFSAYALEHYVADLQKALEERTGELNARAQTVADLEGQLWKLRNESESIRIRTLIERSKKVEAARPAEVKPAVTKRGAAPNAVTTYEGTLTQIPAYRLLKERDPGFYDGWLKEYQVLLGQGLSDKQLNDALRGSQARWMKRHLSSASDQTVVAYIRLLVDQIDEFLLEGAEPCLAFLVPQPRPAKGIAPDYSHNSRQREIELLEKVLATQDARRMRPKESDVWPDLEPIFAALFEQFGADNVAAIENSFDPARDRALLCNVSRTLFMRILALPEPKAAAALRWMLASK